MNHSYINQVNETILHDRLMKETKAQEPSNSLEMNIKLLKENESIVCCTNLKIQHLQNDKYTNVG